jgi:nucleotide-binding universal stress UspA family protein
VSGTSTMQHRAVRRVERRPHARPQEPVPGAPTVVVGYDGSDDARAAFDVALEHAGADGTVVVAHAIPSRPQALRTEEERRFRDLTLGALERLMPRSGGEATVEARVLRGGVADVLTGLAAARGAGLIVVGARGRGGRTALGSSLCALLRQATCPVLVVSAPAAAQR